MFNRRNFLQTAGAVAAVSTFNIRKASAADDLNWSIHCDLTGPAAEGGKTETAHSRPAIGFPLPLHDTAARGHSG